jgi:hypothetical protein
VSGPRPLLYGPGQEVLAWAGQGREAALQQIALEAFWHLAGLPREGFDPIDPRHIAQQIGRVVGAEALRARYPRLQIEVRPAKPGEEVP